MSPDPTRMPYVARVEGLSVASTDHGLTSTLCQQSRSLIRDEPGVMQLVGAQDGAARSSNRSATPIDTIDCWSNPRMECCEPQPQGSEGLQNTEIEFGDGMFSWVVPWRQVPVGS
jgi:hypothetical protein